MNQQSKSLENINESVDTNKNKSWKKFFSFLGPAYLVSIGYMDPGNWATDLSGGSKFGYSLLWVLLMSNLMAIFLQLLAARLGIVYGRDLAQINRESFPKKINYIFYGLAEIAIIATDLAEVLGMAIGLNLLFNLPLTWGVTITIADTFLLLYLQQFGIRKLELFIISLIAIIAGSFIIELIIAKPSIAEISKGFIPTLPNNEALYIAIGIIGATIMPHNLYLHSALVQTRKINKDFLGIKKALKINFIDSAIALNIAFFINAAILILASSTFYKNNLTNVVEINQAYKLLTPMLGSNLAPILFGIALIAAGQSSTITGTLSGQIVMEGYLQLRLNPWIRRLLTRLLATIPVYFILIFTDSKNITKLLILSQVVLSCQLGFAIIPLIHFVSDKIKMKEFAINIKTKIIAWCIVVILVTLNIKMIFNEVELYLNNSHNIIIKSLIIILCISLFSLLLYVTFYPLYKHKLKLDDLNSKYIHPKKITNFLIPKISKPNFKIIAIPLDFSINDQKLISYAIQQSNIDTKFVLIHIVESVNAKMYGKEANDLETIQDKEYLNLYKTELEKLNINTEIFIGYKNRHKEILNIIKEQKADFLVIGSHGHKALKDILFGETINKIRHEVTIPILVVNLDNEI